MKFHEYCHPKLAPFADPISDHPSRAYMDWTNPVVEQIRWLLENTSAKIVLISHVWQTKYLNRMKNVIEEHPSRFLVALGEFRWRGWFPNEVQKFTIPHKATSLLEQPVKMRSRRPALMYFAGMCQRRERGWKRAMVMKNLQENSSHVVCKPIKEIYHGDIDYMQQALENVEHLLQSKFCLIPAGDTPTSRRMYDALAAGCIPVYMGSYEELKPNLPFPNTINWDDIVVFAGNMTCLGDEVQSANMIDYLQNAKWTPKASFTLRKVFQRHLSYSSLGLVDAMLLEIDELIGMNEHSRHVNIHGHHVDVFESKIG